jgi:hypothetical protein
MPHIGIGFLCVFYLENFKHTVLMLMRLESIESQLSE